MNVAEWLDFYEVSLIPACPVLQLLLPSVYELCVPTAKQI